MTRVPDYDAFDEVMVRHLVEGDYVDPARTIVYPEDVAEAVRRLAALGFSDGQIAYRLGYRRRSVQRIRTRRSIPAALTHRGSNATHAYPGVPTRS